MVLEILSYLGKSNFGDNQKTCTPIHCKLVSIKGYSNILEKTPVKDIVVFGARKSNRAVQEDLINGTTKEIVDGYLKRAELHLKFATQETDDAFRYSCYVNRAYGGAYEKKYTPQQVVAIKRNSKNKANGFYDDTIRHIKAAISDYSKAIEEDPRNIDAYLGRGRIYMNKVNKSKQVLDSSRQELQKAEESHYIPEIYRQIQEKYKKDLATHKTLLTNIVNDYSKVISLSPNNFIGYMARGKANYELQKLFPEMNLKKAIICDISVAIKLNPKNIQAYTTRADASYELYLKEEFNDQIAQIIEQDCTKAIELTNNRETLALEAYKFRGLLNYERVMTLGEGDEFAHMAIRDLRTYFKYNMQDLDICNKLAELHSAIKDKEGFEYFRDYALKIHHEMN